jgi:V8-like Glu-specific endopeptidase
VDDPQAGEAFETISTKDLQTPSRTFRHVRPRDLTGEWLPGLCTVAVNDLDEDAEALPAGFRRTTHSGGRSGLRQIFGADSRAPVLDASVEPFCWICHLEIVAANGEPLSGTGWLASDRLVVTAGHCVWDKERGNRFARSIEVFAGRNGRRSVASTKAKELFTVRQWAQATEGRSEHDFGALQLEDPLGESLGHFSFADVHDEDLLRTRLNIVGYPADKPFGTQWGHAQLALGVSRQRIDYQIDTWAGHSGSPVFSKTSDRYTVLGIHNSGSSTSNMAARINSTVFDTIKSWKGM